MAENLAPVVKQLQKKGTLNKDGKTWIEWLNSLPNPPIQSGGRTGIEQDPWKIPTETLHEYLMSTSTDVQSLVSHQVLRSQRARLAFSDLQQANRSSDGALARVVTLVQHTRAHRRYGDNYGALLSNQVGWVMAPERTTETPQCQTNGKLTDESLLIAIDCEMVETADEQNALARVCVCDGECRVLLDRLVCPSSPPTDFRTPITGITARTLEGVKYTRADAQADLQKLITPLTVVVGHTLSSDLDALQLDVPLVADVGFLYGIEKSPNRMPALAHLVKTVLGCDDFRGADGRAVHNCVDDVIFTMKLFLHRLKLKHEGQVPPMIWVPQYSTNGDKGDAHMLYAHRIPNGPGVFASLVAFFSALGDGSVSEGLEAVNVSQALQTRTAAAQGLCSANIVFKSPSDATNAFAKLQGTSMKNDGLGRPQKCVKLNIASKMIEMYIRPCSVDTPVAGSTQAAEVVDANSKPSKVERWLGFRRAAEDALLAADGELPWKKLRSTVVDQCQKAGQAGNASEEELGWQALASIPTEYLSKEDEYVRLPPL